MSSRPDPAGTDQPVLVRLRVAPERGELISEALFDAGATGIEEQAPTAPGADPVLLAGFPHRDAALVALARLAPTDVVDALVEVPPDTWFDGWRAYARPQRVGNHLVVVPSWIPFAAGDGDVVLSIDPGRSFGSGAHPSTRLVLAEMEAVLGPGASVLDVGSGSGVLSVAAVKLGASSVTAVDIEPAALAATLANAERNGVAPAVTVADTLPAGPFDLVVANIGANALISMAPRLVAAAPAVVLAGFLAERAAEVAAAYAEAGAPTRARRDLDGWSALTSRR